MKLWASLLGLFRKKKPKVTTQVLKMPPRPTFSGNFVSPPPKPDLNKAITEDQAVCHVDFGKVRKITGRYSRHNKKITDFYDDSGELITD